MIPPLEICAAGILGSTGSIFEVRGVASCNKAGTGLYELTLERPLPNAGTVVELTPLGPSARMCSFELLSQTVVVVRVFDETGAALDSAVAVVIAQVPGTRGES